MTGLWANVEDLDAPTSPNAAEALATASYLIWVLSGRRWSGWHTVTEEYVCDGFVSGTDGWFPSTQQWQVGVDHFITTTSDPYWGERPGQRFLFLRRRPARELLFVRDLRTGIEIDLNTLAIYDHAYLAPNNAGCCCDNCWDPCCLEVTYKWGGPPPPAGVTAVLDLANEFVKAIECPDECKLPQRVTSVSRQGVNYQIFDPQDFLTDGRLGLYSVDVFLKSVNPNKAQLPARVFSRSSDGAKKDMADLRGHSSQEAKLNDWIGTPKPVNSSAPPWPRDWRIWWDPKARHQQGDPAVPPTIAPMPPQISFPNPPEFSGTGCAGGQIQLELEPGGYDTWFMVDANGDWTWTPVQPLPPGSYCVRVRQRCPETADSDSSDWSEWTDPVCFDIITIVQTIDFEANDLRYDSVNGWPVRGVLKYNINGIWTMGVLRHNVQP